MSPYSSKARAPCRARGFSLLEVLVAFVVLALGLGVTLRIFSQGMDRVGESDSYARAVMLAESKLAEIGAGIPLAEGEASGESEDALRWRVRLAEYPIDADKPKADSQGAPQALPLARLLQAEVEVSWTPAQSAPRSVRLATLKLAPRIAP